MQRTITNFSGRHNFCRRWSRSSRTHRERPPCELDYKLSRVGVLIILYNLVLLTLVVQ